MSTSGGSLNPRSKTPDKKHRERSHYTRPPRLRQDGAFSRGTRPPRPRQDGAFSRATRPPRPAISPTRPPAR
jgi:hypothetical protein